MIQKKRSKSKTAARKATPAPVRTVTDPLVARAVQNRDKYRKKAKEMEDQGKTDHAEEMTSRANFWELELQALQKKRKR